MDTPFVEQLLRNSGILLALLCGGTIVLFAKKRILTKHALLVSLLAVQAIAAIISTGILFYRHQLGLDIDVAFNIYFYSHWVLFTCEAILQVAIIYSVFNDAMRPLQGLQHLGKTIFRWVAAVSILVSIAFAASPHTATQGSAMTGILSTILTQLQQGVSILTLCLLLFVTFSTKPLGLTYRSRNFGIVFGLGVMSCTTLVQAAWVAIDPATSLYSPISVFGTIGSVVAISVWTAYFALPEPAARMILLPTTSPFFLWNRISEALGDSPGHVAIAGFRPEMLAVAEFEMLTAPNAEVPETAFDAPFAPTMLTAAAR